MLLLFALAGADTLTTEPYCRVGRLLHGRRWNVASLDLPCHGADRRAGEPAERIGWELDAWAARIATGENIVADFRQRVSDVVTHLIQEKLADPGRIAAAGISRGGFMAFHAAAGDPRIRAVAAFAPVTDLLALSEFAGQAADPLVRGLALANIAAALADRAIWISIGNHDERVNSQKAAAFALAAADASAARGLDANITLHLLPTPGHTTQPEWHDDAAGWLQKETVEEHAPNPTSHR